MKKLPKIFKSRAAWGEYFELKRTEEPHVHQIEPTNYCPYSCMMCPRTNHMTRDTGFMQLDLYRKIIDEIDTFQEPIRSKEIELFHFGESLIHPRLPEMIAYASGKGLNMVLSINPPSLNRKKIHDILDAKPSKIILSLDGHDSTSYRKIRGKRADYDKALENIKILLAYHKKIKSEIKLIIRMIEFNLNTAYTEKFKMQWQREGLDVEIREFFPWTKKEMVKLGKVRKWRPYMPCPFPWQYVAIQYNGDVVPCCRDYNGVNRIMNVKDHTLKEIWNSEKYASFRRQHITGNYTGNDFCKECMDIYYCEE